MKRHEEAEAFGEVGVEAGDAHDVDAVQVFPLVEGAGPAAGEGVGVAREDVDGGAAGGEGSCEFPRGAGYAAKGEGGGKVGGGEENAHRLGYHAMNRRASGMFAWEMLLLAALVAAVYATTLNAPFIYDDYETIVNNDHIKQLTNPMGVLFYSGTRPVLFLTFAINYALEGLESRYTYHIFNVVTHVATSALVFLLTEKLAVLSGAFVRRRRGSLDAEAEATRGAWLARVAGLFAAAIFAVHPLNTETVTYISSRSDGLSTFFYLWAIWLFVAYEETPSGDARKRTVRLIATLSVSLLALLTKEVAVTLPIVLLAIHRFFVARAVETAKPGKAEAKGRSGGKAGAEAGGKTGDEAATATRARIAFGALGAVFLGLLAWRLYVLPDEMRESPLPRGVIENLLTQAHVTFRYLGMWFWPSGQSIVPDFPVIGELVYPLTAVVLLAIALWIPALIVLARSAPFVAATVAWYAVTLAPTAVLPMQETMSEHRAYLPNVGLAMLTGYLFAWLRSLRRGDKGAPVERPFWKFEPLTGAVAVGLIVVATVTAYARASVWNDPVDVWGDCIDKSPTYGGCHYAFADHVRERADKWTAVLQELRKQLAIEHDAKNVVAVERLMDQAKVAEEQAKSLYRSAAYHYEQMLIFQGVFPDALVNIGICHAQIGEFETAEQFWRMGLKEVESEGFRARNPHLDTAELRIKFLNNIARMEMNRGRYEAAEKIYKEILEDDPRHVLTHLNLSELYRRQQRFIDSFLHAETASEIMPTWDPRYELVLAALEDRRRLVQISQAAEDLGEPQPRAPATEAERDPILSGKVRIDTALPDEPAEALPATAREGTRQDAGPTQATGN